ncbi:MAG: acyl-CoA dehydrogenase [Deltaproteobacteria bacterium]|nr:acyl-CoA dehydrogenase [Deltaproteobacteria bacterium]
MAFRLSQEQEELRQGFRDFCTGRVSLERVRALEGSGFERDLWRELAEMGVFHLRAPESAGGLGLGHVEAALVFAELGRAIAPGPLVWSHLASGLVDGAARGETVVTGLDLASSRRGPIVLEHLGVADAVLVLREDGVARLDPKSIRSERIETPLDPLTPVSSAAALPAGERLGGADLARDLRQLGTVLTAGMLLGIAEATHVLAVDYAKERKQFDRPIGSFQAIKHMLADTFVRQEIARASVYAAAATLDHPEVADVATVVSEAKITAGEAAMKNARTCIQVQGGMGYTWELPSHLFLKRTWVLESSFGTIEEHADQLAEGVGAAGT